MKKNMFYILVCSFFVVDCGGSKITNEATIKASGQFDVDVPDWYLTPPENETILYQPAVGNSKDMQLAVNKATTEARREIGTILEARIMSMQKKFEEETGSGKDAELLASFTQTVKVIVSTTLYGTKISKQKIKTDGSTYTAYVLMELPLSGARAELLNKIKGNDQMYTRYRATQSFKDLDSEVEKYEKFKKEQGAK